MNIVAHTMSLTINHLNICVKNNVHKRDILCIFEQIKQQKKHSYEKQSLLTKFK